MYIVNQKKDRVYNFDRFQQMFVNDNTIQCKCGSDVVVMATYPTPERTLEVFDEVCRLIYTFSGFIALPEE